MEGNRNEEQEKGAEIRAILSFRDRSFIEMEELSMDTEKMKQDLGGRGWYQEWGKPAQELHAGDVVNIPPEVKHWHGAAKDSWFQHLAVEVPAEGASNEWLEAVSGEEYEKLK